MRREGSLDAPVRHPIDWQDPDYTDFEKIDEELRRVFDICHGCRRCFNLCDVFPRLFDLIDNSSSGELDTVESKDFANVVDACTLCDLCFINKCPYVPPHEFNIDFPHLMVRYRFAEFQKGRVPWTRKQLAKTDQNGKIATALAPLANWASHTDNTLTRPILERAVALHQQAPLPTFQHKTLLREVKDKTVAVNPKAPAYGQEKVAIYATCFGNYNQPKLGLAAQAILAHNGVEVTFVYPGCCGMPAFEQGNLKQTTQQAKIVASSLRPYIERGYKILSLIPSCSLMLKMEWPLLVTEDESVKLLSQNTQDISEYIIDLHHTFGLVEGLRPMADSVTLHLACHARAQNMGQKAAEMLRLIPNFKVDVIERCSGHGGTWGMMVDHFEVALKVGKPAFRQIIKNASSLISSECPLAAEHLKEGVTRETQDISFETLHPLEILAQSYDLSY